MFNSIQVKVVALLIGFFLVQALVLFAILGKLENLNDRYKLVFEQEGAQRSQVEDMSLHFKTQVQEWKNVLLRGHDPQNLEKYWSKFEHSHQEVEAMASQLLVSPLSADIAKKITRFSEVHVALMPKYQLGLNAFKESFDPKAGDAAVAGIDRAPSEALSELSETITSLMSSRLEAISVASAKLVWAVDLVVICMSIVACLALSFIIRNLLVKPIRQLQVHIDAMARCDFSSSLDFVREDEFGQLSHSLGDMRKELSKVLGSVMQVSEGLSQSSGELSTAAKEIDDDTHHAQDYAGQIAAAMTEMGASIAEVANNASVAADATDVANRGAEKGLRIMDEAIVAISAVRDEVTKISGDMSRLEQNTTSVGAVLDVIKGIAEQTNLLALNAAIEAARAGEQGRGFAVVADEVRALAKRTQESTEEIQHIIESVQNGAKAASNGMDAGNQKTANAVTLARDAGLAIRQIAEEISRVQAMSAQIATAAEEQSAATDEINRNVNNMTSLSGKAHVSAANTHAIATDLYAMVDRLSEIAVKFTLTR